MSDPEPAPTAAPAPVDAPEPMEQEPVEIPEVPPAFEPPSDGRRLMITRMVLENFKSYAGVKEIGPFHQCFSAVVGPNGSGKSNVIDAMLFVFGKRAKKLRLNKVAELIHNSEQHPDCEYAKVSVYFQDIIDTPDDPEGQPFAVVPGSELVVSRTARRDSSSRYEVDGRTHSFTEVMRLLRARGIDLDNNRFLILQGEIEQIAMMKPKAASPHEDGLLEYLEDIIGSNRFVEATEAAQAEADRLAEARGSHLQRVKAAEAEKDGLEEAKVEAEAFVAKELAVCRKRNVLFQLERRAARASRAEAEAETAALNERLTGERAKLAEANEQLTAVEARYKTAQAEHKTLDEQLQKVKTDFAGYERQDIKLREDVRHATSQKDSLKAKAKRESKKESQLRQTAQEQRAAIPELEAAAEAAAQAKAAAQQQLEQAVEAAQAQTATLRESIDEKRAQLEPLQQAVNDTAADKATIETELALLTKETDDARAELQQAERDLARLSNADSLQAELDQSLQTKRDKEEQLADAQRRLAHAERQRDAAQSELREKRRLCEEARASHNAASSRGRLLDQLMRAARPGGALARAGLLGRLGDLGAIDDEYDVAVSTACGALDHLVVETAAGGRKCIEFLRENNLGRATFIVLEELRDARRAMAKPCRAPDGFSRLFDLVRPREERFAVAFYYGLRNTLVAPDLDAAVAVAYQGSKCVWRVVTQQGQLIDTSGVMSGGGNRVRRGGMSASSSSAANQAPEMRPEDIASLERDVVDLQRTADTAANDARRAASDARRLEGELTKLALRISKLQLDVESAAPQAEALRARIEELRQHTDMSRDSAKQAKQLQKRLDAASAAHAAAQEEAAGLEAEVDALQAQVLEAGGASEQEHLDQASHALDAAQRAVTKANVDAKAADKNADKARDAAAKAESDLDEVRATLARHKTQLEELEEAAAAVMAQIDSTQALRDETVEQLRAAQADFDGLKKTVTKIQSAEVDIVSQLEDAARAAAEASAAEDSWTAKLDEIRATYNALAPSFSPTVAADEGEAEAKGDEDPDADEDDEPTPEPAPEHETTLEDFPDDHDIDVDEEALLYDITILEQERDQLKGSVNMQAIVEFRQKEADYLARVGELEQVTTQRDAARARHEDLRRQRLEEFMAGFSVITLKLKEMYQMITLGGDAELELVDSLDPFSEGIVFSVRPSKKSWKNISNLSGGEKTLSSLALVFALHHYKPTPLYVMDEIDAALDFKNVSIVANYIKERTKDAQFIIISLRNNMFELADRLVGIYKTNNSTKSVTINPHKLAARAAAIAPPAPPLADRTNA